MSKQRWRVNRQDDNGNVYMVAETASEADACSIAQLFDARAHKQMYWVEPVVTAAQAPYRT